MTITTTHRIFHRTLTTGQAAWRLLAVRPWLYALGFILSVIFENMPLVTGLILRAFFDRLSKAAPAGLSPLTLIALLVASDGVRMTALGIGYWCWAELSVSLRALMRKNVFAWLMLGPGAQKLPGGAGDAVNRFRDDVDQVYDYLEGYIDLGSGVVFAVVAVVIMARIDPVATVAIAVPLVAIGAVVNALNDRIRGVRERSRSAAGRVSDFVAEAFGAVETIKLRGANPNVVAHFRQLNARRAGTALNDRLLSQALESFNANAANVGLGLMLLLVAQAMRVGRFTVGDFALFVTYMPWLADFPAWIGRMIARYTQSDVSVERLGAILPAERSHEVVRGGDIYGDDLAPTIATETGIEDDPLQVLEIRDLQYHYPGSDRGIDAINFTLPAGTCTVIAGRIGSGKTTLLRVILGLLPRDSGEIRWNDDAIADPATFFTPPRSAYTPQLPRLWSDTLAANITLGRDLPASVLDQVIYTAVLDDDVANMEAGAATVVGPRGMRLSGGQVQRTAAARMLATCAQLLVFDDLSSALDLATEQSLWSRLFDRRDQHGTHTYLVVSNRPAMLARADHIVVLDAGRIVAEGRLADLLQTSPHLAELWSGGEASAPSTADETWHNKIDEATI